MMIWASSAVMMGLSMTTRDQRQLLLQVDDN